MSTVLNRAEHSDPRWRRIVKLAAQESKLTRSWLERDERGVWEKMACDTWGHYSGYRTEKGWSDQQFEEAVAGHLVLLALETLSRKARKRG